jgi:putative endonuclease
MMVIKPDKELMDHITVQDGYHVYMVRCVDGSLYTGYAKNVEQRVATHNAGKGGRYTRSHLPVILLASWSFNSKGEALRAEHHIKRLPRERKWQLIAMPSLYERSRIAVFNAHSHLNHPSLTDNFSSLQYML